MKLFITLLRLGLFDVGCFLRMAGDPTELNEHHLVQQLQAKRQLNSHFGAMRVVAGKYLDAQPA